MQTYLLLFVAMAAIFYLLILRPQQRAKKAKAEMAQALEIGSDVLTVGGIYGSVAELRLMTTSRTTTMMMRTWTRTRQSSRTAATPQPTSRPRRTTTATSRPPRASSCVAVPF